MHVFCRVHQDDEDARDPLDSVGLRFEEIFLQANIGLENIA